MVLSFGVLLEGNFDFLLALLFAVLVILETKITKKRSVYNKNENLLTNISYRENWTGGSQVRVTNDPHMKSYY